MPTHMIDQSFSLILLDEDFEKYVVLSIANKKIVPRSFTVPSNQVIRHGC